MSIATRVIVIGAGAIGCATAWHLRQRGCEVVLVEAEDGPASQASRAAAGFVAHWSTHFITAWGAVEWAMQDYGIDFYTELARRHDEDLGFAECGMACIYLDKDAWLAARGRVADARELGTQLEVLSSQRCQALLPGIDATRTAAIVYEPTAIRVRAADVIPALARDLAQHGVDIRYGARVAELLSSDGHVTGIRTTDETFKGDLVVVAAGAWTRPLVHAAGGGHCPADPLVETRYTTKPLPDVPPDMPLLIFQDCHGIYIREERGGLLIGGESDAGEVPVDGDLPADRRVDPMMPPVSRDIVPDQAFRVREYLRKIEEVMPALQGAEINQIDSGLPTFTRDYRFIVDEVPTLRGAWFVSGCNEGGISHGPGLGRLVTELVLDGASDWDCFRTARLLDWESNV